MPPRAALSAGPLRELATVWSFALHAYLALASMVLPPSMGAALSGDPALRGGPRR